MRWESQRIGKARASWKGMGKDVAMTELFVVCVGILFYFLFY